MTERFATTPFGGGRMTAAKFRRREEIDRQRQAARSGGNDTGKAEKWALLKALTEARVAFDLSDRTIAVLEALLSFHPERELDGSAPIIVFPSNVELSLRARGMADATLRRHLAALAEAGLLLRRDSPNGKRYCRRDGHGAVEDAFGFDLSPLALAAAAIFAAADDMRAEQRACQRLRGEITIHLRDTAKVIEAALAEKRAGDWQGFSLALMPLGRRLPRQVTREVLDARLEGLTRLRADVETAYLDALSEQEMSANDVDSGRHYQNSKPDHQLEESSEKELKRNRHENGARDERLEADGAGKLEGEGRLARADGGAPGPQRGRAPETKGEPVPLAYLLRVCPTLAHYARGGAIVDWHGVVTTAGLVRAMLGVSPDAWEQARAAMGELGAAITIAAMLERADDIRSAGGYLRALTERAEAGRFSWRPMLSALEGRGDG